MLKMKRIYRRLFFLSFILQPHFLVCQTTQSGSEGGSPRRTPSLTELDWDKFDHLYDLDQDHLHVPSTPPPEVKLSKETQLALTMLDNPHLTHSSTAPQRLTYSQKNYRDKKAREQMKVEKMSSAERDAFFDQKKAKQRLASERRKQRMGFSTYTAKKYNTLRNLVNTKTANPTQVEKLEEIRKTNRLSRKRWRDVHKEKVKEVLSYDLNGKLTPEQIENVRKYEAHKEKMRKASQRARDKKKLMKKDA